jgi:hypothetical protein
MRYPWVAVQVNGCGGMQKESFGSEKVMGSEKNGPLMKIDAGAKGLNKFPHFPWETLGSFFFRFVFSVSSKIIQFS